MMEIGRSMFSHAKMKHQDGNQQICDGSKARSRGFFSDWCGVLAWRGLRGALRMFGYDDRVEDCRGLVLVGGACGGIVFISCVWCRVGTGFCVWIRFFDWRV